MERGPTCVVQKNEGGDFARDVFVDNFPFGRSVSNLEQTFVVALSEQAMAGVRDSDDVTRRAAACGCASECGEWPLTMLDSGCFQESRESRGVLIECIQLGHREAAGTSREEERAPTNSPFAFDHDLASRTRVLAPTLQVRARRCPTTSARSLCIYWLRGLVHLPAPPRPRRLCVPRRPSLSRALVTTPRSSCSGNASALLLLWRRLLALSR